jgi:hypothetical protein
LRGFIYGSEPNCEYDDWISHISRGYTILYANGNNYNNYAPWQRHHPSHPFGEFRQATTQELSDWLSVCAAFVAGNYTLAISLIDEYDFPYDVVKFNDTDTGRIYYMLRERLNLDHFDDHGTTDPNTDVTGGFDYGWGLFVVWPDSPQPIVVSLVHPDDDFMVPPLAVKAFQDWDAKYLMIAGASREIAWHGSSFINDRSLSDPSRVSDHPFNSFYRSACTEIRTTFGRREYSAQLHSFDYNSNLHRGIPNIQISAGPSQDFPALPIRDFSSEKNDIIHQFNHLVFPANTIGIHEAVYLNDYMSVFYDRNLQPFIFSDGVNTYPVSNLISLPGASTNVQFAITNADRNKWDTLSTFFHVEFSELPYCYPATTSYYQWFYGFDILTGKWDLSRRFEKVLDYYSPFIENMRQPLHDAIALNTGSAPPTPANFHLASSETTRITLRWDPVDCYDFNSWEVHYSTTPGSGHIVFDRSNDSTLSSAMTRVVTMNSLAAGTTYYIKMRTRDTAGRTSAFTDEITVNFGLANINFHANTPIVSLNEQVTLTWSGASQASNMLGYRVYRSTEGGTFTQIADWTTNPGLSRTGASQNFSFTDNTVSNFVNYQYRVAAANATNEFMHHRFLNASPRPMYRLTLESLDGSISDTVTLGFSPFCTNGINVTSGYDIIRGSSSDPAHQIHVWEASWIVSGVQGQRVSRRVKADIDPTTQFQTYTVRIRSGQGNVRLRLEGNDDFANRNTEKVVIYHASSGAFGNLSIAPFEFSATTGYTTYTVFIGDLKAIPGISNIATLTNRIYEDGDSFNINISTLYPQLLSHYVVTIENDTESFLVNGNVSPSTSTISVDVPPNRTMHDARIVFTAHAIDGGTVRYEFGQIGILPFTKNIAFQTGFNLVSNPLPNDSIPLNSLHASATLHELVDSIWEPVTDEIAFGTGYFLNIPSDFSHSYISSAVKTTANYFLLSGWNLLANPHYRDFDISDLQFTLAGTTYQYGEMLQNNILLPYVRVLRDGLYQRTTVVRSSEAFWLYVNNPTTSMIRVHFVPYLKNAPIISSNFDWAGALRVSSTVSEWINDEIVVSVHNDFDRANHSLEYFNPKTIKLPGGISFYLHETGSTTQFHSRTVPRLTKTEEAFIDIPFTLVIPQIELLRFDFEYISRNLDYQMKLVIGGFEHHFWGTTERTVEYMPTSTTITGMIRIVNEFLTPNIDILAKPFAINAYPNPFNPTTNIAFDLPSDSHVELSIFNIKGQKVITLANNMMPSGQHVVRWDGVDNTGRSVASGIYFISVQTSERDRIVRKVTLIK